MELTGRLKDSVMNAKTKDEKKGLIEKAGMKLTDDELDMVAGGVDYNFGHAFAKQINTVVNED